MAKRDPVLDREILALSQYDVLRFRDLIEGGTLITGGLGSGKSSTSGRALAMGFLRAGLGGLILTVKSDETQRWIEYAEACGREKDLVIFNAESGLSFDPLAYTWNQPGRGAGYLETIVEMFTSLMSIGRPQVSASSESRYFELAVESLLRNVLVLLALAGERISITSIHKVISTLPTMPDEIETEEWQKCTAAMLVNTIKGQLSTFSPEQNADLDTAIDFTLRKWPALDDRTRSNIESTWTGMADKFTFDPFRRMFCSGEFSFTPEQITHERKLVILDMPVLEYGRDTARLMQIMVKIVCQRAWLRHQYKPGCCHGAFLFQDEFSLLMHRHENHFHQVCRSSAIATVCLTPNIMNIAAEEFGESKPGSRTLGFLGNLTVKIFHHQTDVETRNYAADVIGKQYLYLRGYSGSDGGNHSHMGISGNQHLAHIVEPLEFTRLVKPDGENPCAEAIVYTGQSFNATKGKDSPEGKNYLRVLFSREI